jgi:hypothetical protein
LAILYEISRRAQLPAHGAEFGEFLASDETEALNDLREAEPKSSTFALGQLGLRSGEDTPRQKPGL